MKTEFIETSVSADDEKELAVLSPAFPEIPRIRVRMHIHAKDMTIWPASQQPEPRRDWWTGFPLELRPCAWDYLEVRCDGQRLTIEPHYRQSTFDTFTIDSRGTVCATALGGLFPFTLGHEIQLLDGIVATLEALPEFLSEGDLDLAPRLREIHWKLKVAEAQNPPPCRIRLRSAHHKIATAHWRAKQRRARRAAEKRVASADD